MITVLILKDSFKSSQSYLESADHSRTCEKTVHSKIKNGKPWNEFVLCHFCTLKFPTLNLLLLRNPLN